MPNENEPQNNENNEEALSFWDRVKSFFKRAWAYLKVAKMEYIVMVSLFAVDMISKIIVQFTMNEYQSVTVIPYVLSFTYTINTNAAFGSDWLKKLLGGEMGARIAFCIFAVAASVVFVLILIRNKGGNKLYRVALAMLTAGALGNCVDRMFLAGVRDFIDLQLFTLITGGWWTYIFNIADCALVIGVVLVIIYFIFMFGDTDEKKAKRKAKREAKAAAKAGTSAAPQSEEVEQTDEAGDGNAEVDAQDVQNDSDGGEAPSIEIDANGDLSDGDGGSTEIGAEADADGKSEGDT